MQYSSHSNSGSRTPQQPCRNFLRTAPKSVTSHPTSFLPSVPTWVSPASQSNSSSSLLEVSPSPPANPPHFFLTGILPNKWDCTFNPTLVPTSWQTQTCWVWDSNKQIPKWKYLIGSLQFGLGSGDTKWEPSSHRGYLKPWARCDHFIQTFIAFSAQILTIHLRGITVICYSMLSSVLWWILSRKGPAPVGMSAFLIRMPIEWTHKTNLSWNARSHGNWVRLFWASSMSMLSDSLSHWLIQTCRTSCLFPFHFYPPFFYSPIQFIPSSSSHLFFISLQWPLLYS